MRDIKNWKWLGKTTKKWGITLFREKNEKHEKGRLMAIIQRLASMLQLTMFFSHLPSKFCITHTLHENCAQTPNCNFWVKIIIYYHCVLSSFSWSKFLGMRGDWGEWVSDSTRIYNSFYLIVKKKSYCYILSEIHETKRV